MESPERTVYLPSVRAYPWERELLLRAAAADQVKVSEYIRRVVVDSARRRIARADRTP
jgi:hypothetical protein